jgi:drug/metabolite transporter (DMT)-like permease
MKDALASIALVVQATAMVMQSSIRLGIALMLVGMFLFAVNDTLGKYMVAAYSVGMLLLVRSVSGLAMLAPQIWREGGWSIVRSSLRPKLFGRSVLSTMESVLFYWAVVYLPVADVVTFYMAVPIFTTALAALFLGETVRWRRWTAIGVGFIGVVIALNPTADVISVGSFIALAGTLSFALLMIITRRMKEEKDITLITGQTLTGILFGLFTLPMPLLFPANDTLPLITGWKDAPWQDLALLALLGIVATLAHMMVTRSLKLAPASVVVPFQYLTIVWAAILGYLVFETVPGWSMVIGCIIIIAAGLYIFSRELVLNKAETSA